MKEHHKLAQTAIPLQAKLAPLPSRGGEPRLHRLFDPLGYTLAIQRHPLDAHFPEWGESRYYTLTLERLRGHGLGKKRSLALREFALGVDLRL